MLAGPQRSCAVISVAPTRRSGAATRSAPTGSQLHKPTHAWSRFCSIAPGSCTLPRADAPGFRASAGSEMQRLGDFRLPPFFNYPPYFTLQPVRETREKQVQLWKDLILGYCRSQKIHTISLEEDFPLFSNPKIERSLSHEAKEVFLAALVGEGRAEWMDKGHKKCLILWLRIQDWANFIINFVKDNGLEVMTIKEIRSGIHTRGTGEFEKLK